MSESIELNPGQQKAYKKIMSGANTFVTGGAGTGKSVLIRKLIRDLESMNRNVVVCAPTWATALNIGGTTIHNVFGFSVGPCITAKRHSVMKRVSRLVRSADVILIDEISMVRMDMMDAICASVKKAEEVSGHPIQLVVIGDFCQLPPVINEKTGEREVLEAYYGHPIGNGFAIQAPGWKDMHFETVQLTTVMRQKDGEFIYHLNRIRVGDVSSIGYFNREAPFGEEPSALSMYAYNRDVDAANTRALMNIPEAEQSFFPIYYGETQSDADLPEPVTLKVGAKVIVTTNEGELVRDQKTFAVSPYIKKGDLHNGVSGTVCQLFTDEQFPDREYAVVRLMTGALYIIRRKTENVYGYTVDSAGDVHRRIIGRISYMPLRLGYGITVHRSQGQTFDSINLQPGGWCSGQLYVSLSRVRSVQGIHLLRAIRSSDLCIDPVVKEFYRSLEEADMDHAGTVEVDIRKEEPVQEVQKEAPVSKRKDKKETPKLVKKASEADTVPRPGKKKREEPEKADREEEEGHGASIIENSTKPALSGKENGRPEDAVTKARRGRPSRFPNGAKAVKIPTELIDEVTWMLNITCPGGKTDMDKIRKCKDMLQKICRTIKD